MDFISILQGRFLREGQAVEGGWIESVRAWGNVPRAFPALQVELLPAGKTGILGHLRKQGATHIHGYSHIMGTGITGQAHHRAPTPLRLRFRGRRYIDPISIDLCAFGLGILQIQLCFFQSQALALHFELSDRIAQLNAGTKELTESMAAIATLATKYADDHPGVFDEPEKEVREGVFQSQLTTEDGAYRLTRSRGELQTDTGDALTQGRLAGLPAEWTKQKLELDRTGIRRLKVSDTELAGYGLVRHERKIWSKIEERSRE